MLLLQNIVSPTRWYNINGVSRRHTVVDSQQSCLRLVSDPKEAISYNEPFPCIFLVGNGHYYVRECFLAFCDVRYKLWQPMNALITAVQVFDVFYLDYPVACSNFWYFVSQLIFGFKCNKHTSMSVKSVINFLESFSLRPMSQQD